jgi:hypothetical protein
MAAMDNSGCWCLTVAMDGKIKLHTMVLAMDSGEAVVRGRCSAGGG